MTEPDGMPPTEHELQIYEAEKAIAAFEARFGTTLPFVLLAHVPVTELTAGLGDFVASGVKPSLADFGRRFGFVRRLTVLLGSRVPRASRPCSRWRPSPPQIPLPMGSEIALFTARAAGPPSPPGSRSLRTSPPGSAEKFWHALSAVRPSSSPDSRPSA